MITMRKDDIILRIYLQEKKTRERFLLSRDKARDVRETASMYLQTIAAI